MYNTVPTYMYDVLYGAFQHLFFYSDSIVLTFKIEKNVRKVPTDFRLRNIVTDFLVLYFFDSLGVVLSGVNVRNSIINPYSYCENDVKISFLWISVSGKRYWTFLENAFWSRASHHTYLDFRYCKKNCPSIFILKKCLESKFTIYFHTSVSPVYYNQEFVPKSLQ